MEKVVVSLGGSVINPGTINTRFLHQFCTIIRRHGRKRQIVIVTGGGQPARMYMATVREKGSYIQDTLGIACTQLHALLISRLLGLKQPVPRTMKELTKLLKNSPIVVCGGFLESPGTTSDGTAAEVARIIGAKRFINITNVQGLFTKDPRKHKDATLVRSLSHDRFQTVIQKHKLKPGQHFILDIHAAQICREERIQICILTGVRNFIKALENKSFTGTVIS